MRQNNSCRKLLDVCLDLPSRNASRFRTWFFSPFFSPSSITSQSVMRALTVVIFPLSSSKFCFESKPRKVSFKEAFKHLNYPSRLPRQRIPMHLVYNALTSLNGFCPIEFMRKFSLQAGHRRWIKVTGSRIIYLTSLNTSHRYRLRVTRIFKFWKLIVCCLTSSCHTSAF